MNIFVEIGKFFKAIFSKLKGFFKKLVTAVKNFFMFLDAAIKEMVQGIKTFLKKEGERLYQQFVAFIYRVRERMWEKQTTTVKEPVSEDEVPPDVRAKVRDGKVETTEETEKALDMAQGA